MSNQSELAQLASVFAGSALSNRNMVINGGMTISQRGSSTTSFNVYLIDRFRNPVLGITQYASTLSHDTDAPSGFSNSLKVTTTTAETAIDAGDLVYIAQEIEGYNLQRLGYGASDAKTATLSFWVKSSVTGTYGVGFYQADGPYNYTATYSISAANTWEYKTIKLSGNTSNSVANDNTAGVRVSFILAAGSTYNDGSASNAWETYATDKFASGHVQNGVVTTLNATWQLTGVQLEIGDTSTPFEHIPYSDQLARCQRYYYKTYNDSTAPSTATNVGIVSSTLSQSFQNTGYIELYNVPYAVKMRASPTITVYDTSGNSGKCNYYQSATLVVNNTITSHAMSENGFAVYSDNVTSKGGIGFHFTADAEL